MSYHLNAMGLFPEMNAEDSSRCVRGSKGYNSSYTEVYLEVRTKGNTVASDMNPHAQSIIAQIERKSLQHKWWATGRVLQPQLHARRRNMHFYITTPSNDPRVGGIKGSEYLFIRVTYRTVGVYVHQCKNRTARSLRKETEKGRGGARRTIYFSRLSALQHGGVRNGWLAITIP